MSNKVEFKDWKARAKTEKEARKQKELTIKEDFYNGKVNVDEYLEVICKKKLEVEELATRKIGLLIDLCCDLIPNPIYNRIIDDKWLTGGSVSNCYISSGSINIPRWIIEDYNLFKDRVSLSNLLSNSYLPVGSKSKRALIYDVTIENNSKLIREGFVLHEPITDPGTYKVIGFNVEPPMDSPSLLDGSFTLEGYVTPTLKEYESFIKKHIKQNCYTAALIVTIYFLLASRDKNYKVNDLHIIGDLLIDMGAISSALRLYAIDERTFNDPNKLSLLAHNAIKAGYLEYSTKLIKKLIDQEPYHPSITIIQVEIKRLEQRHILSSKLSIDFSKVEELSGIEFENLLLDKFVSLGFKVEPTPKTGDYGADLIVENNDGSRIIFQCKRFKSKVNLKAVQEVVGAMGHYAGDYGVVITNNTFLNSAVKLAESHDIELWDGDKLISFLAGDLSFSEILS